MIYPVNEESLSLAAEAIRAGNLAAFPTETVYGLGGDAFNPQALSKIFEAKGRPRFDPLIVHIACLDALDEVAGLARLAPGVREAATKLMAVFWPGPLTLVLPKRERIPDLATSGLPSVAVRFPAHPAAQELIRRSTGAVAAPSANRFGMLSPTRAEHVAEQLGGRVDIILDGGPAAVGVESTVLDLSGPGAPRILRPGGLSRQRLEALLGPLAAPGEAPAGSSGSGETRASPGLLKSHYAPHTPLVLHSPQEMAAMPCDGGLGYLFFTSASHDRWRALQTPLGASDITVRESGVMQNVEILSEKGDTLEAAAKLFDCLHRLDKQGLRYIHAEAAPPEALGEAINDRLTRAAATG